MAGSKSAYLEPKALDGVLGGTNFTQPATTYIALFTDTNTQAQRTAGTVTEPSGNAYARLSVTSNSTNWPASSGSNPTTKSNGIAFTFATPTPAGWGDVHAFGIYDAVTSGNLLYWGDLLATEKPCTVTSATPAVFTCPAHGFVSGDKIKFSTLPGVSLPTGLTDGAYYFVITAGLTTDAFEISLTSGGSAVNTTGSGGGKVGKDQTVTVNANVPPSFAIGALVINEY